MKRILFALSLATLLGSAGTASAQNFVLRTGADVRPLLFLQDGDFQSIGDLSYLGVHIAPGLSLGKVLTLELDLVPLINIGGDEETNFLISPGIFLDFMVAYARLAVPINVIDPVELVIEAGGGLSFMGSGYAGVLVNYFTRRELAMVGLEVGWRFSL